MPRTCESIQHLALTHPRHEQKGRKGGSWAPSSFLRVLGYSMGARSISPSLSLSPCPSYLPFLRAIGRYHCQNGNGPIKIPNRCYDRSFVVPYEPAGIRKSVGMYVWGGDGRPYSTLRIRSLDRLLIPVRADAPKMRAGNDSDRRYLVDRKFSHVCIMAT